MPKKKTVVVKQNPRPVMVVVLTVLGVIFMILAMLGAFVVFRVWQDPHKECVRQLLGL